MGWSAGLTLVKVGGVGMPWGRRRVAWVMAACTSTAAPSSLRARSNSRVIWGLPSEFELDIEFMPAMVENWVSSGAGAGESGGDQQGGEIDVGQIANRELTVGHATEQGDGGHQQAGGDGPLNKGLGDIHR